MISVLSSCKKEPSVNNNTPFAQETSTIPPSKSEETRNSRPTILGEKKQNPFSISNMQRALDTLLAQTGKNQDSTFKQIRTLSSYEMQPTDLYVRFLPADSTQYRNLYEDKNLTLFDTPLDYDIKQAGDYYQDPSVSNGFTWLYTTVKPGYKPPQHINYEVLSELFIIENSKDYTEEVLSSNKTETLESKKIIDKNTANALYIISFGLTGNADELQLPCKDNQQGNVSKTISDSKTALATYKECYRSCVWFFGWRCWTDCDTYYYPDGYIKVNTPKGDLGVKGALVRMRRWFTWAYARTDANGYYSSNTRFNKVWGNDICYTLFFDGQNGNNSWDFYWVWYFPYPISITHSYGLGYHSPNGHSATFYTNSDYWGRCVLNNAFYDYINIARRDGIALPPSSLNVYTSLQDDLTASTPLLNNHFNFSLLKAYPNILGLLGMLYQYAFSLGGAFPDIILRYNKDINKYNKITSTAWHELTHASQLQRLKSEKNYAWASDYWSANVYQQVNNGSDNPYGKKGDSQWQLIALSEGWAYYREWKMAKDYLGWNSLSNGTFDGSKFPLYYGGMFEKLASIGCTFSELEKALVTYSIAEFKTKLVSYYPHLSSKISNIISYYE